MNCLVTGGAGFIGSHVAAELVRLNHRVVVLDDLSGGLIANAPTDAQFIQGSIEDADGVDRLFREHRFDSVFHLAAYAAEGLSHFIRRFNYRNNLMGSINLINACARYDTPHFVFTSSIAVYGAAPAPMTEDAAPRPLDPYGIAKYAVELDLAAAHDMFGLNYTIFRPHNVYGPRQNIADPYRNVIAIFMRQMMQGEPLTIFGDGEQTRAFSYIGEVAPLIARAPAIPEAQGEVFNIGADQPVTLKALAHEIASLWGRPAAIQHLPARHEVVHAHADHSKLRRVFPCPERSWTLQEGLAAMRDWVRGHALAPPRRFEAIEVRRNLPENWTC